MRGWAALALLAGPVHGGETAPFRLIPSFVSYRNQPGPTGESAITHMVGSGICVLDFDMDGAWDLFFPNHGGGRLFRSRGPLDFRDVTAEAGISDSLWSVGCAAADVDNDGDPDLFLTRLGPDALFRNRGDGTFVEVAEFPSEEAWSTSAAFGDLDLDGFADLYVCRYIDLDRVDLRQRCLYFGVPVFCGPNGLPGAPDALYRNDGGRFRDVTREAGVHSPETRGFSALILDLDGDRYPEIHVANDATVDLLFRNLGAFRFEDVSLLSGAGYSGLGMEQSGMGSAAGDFDSDGDEDLYVTNFQRDYNTLFRNDGDLSFQDATGGAGLALPTLPRLGWGAHFLDVENDGRLDLFVANGHIYPELEKHPEIGEPYAQPTQLFLGSGAGSFRETAPVEDPPLRLGRGTAVADVNDDGGIDAMVNNLGGAPDLYLAETPGGSWIRLRFAGTSSNRDGLGAAALAGGSRRTLHLSDGFLGSSEPVLHFGLGDARAASISILWPSGVHDRCEDLPAETTYIVKEGRGCLPKP